MDAIQSREDYLENILILSKKKGQVRNVDIATQMNFSRPSVSVAIKKLEKDGYVTVSEDGNIQLTSKGRKHAEQVYERHLVLTLILMEVGVEKNQASIDACKVEHCLSDESFAKICEYYLKYIHDKK
jgi:Mn-dependent DtxR family transcriptional regulator